MQLRPKLFLVVFPAFFAERAFECADGFLDIIQAGIDAQRVAKSLQGGLVLAKLHVAAAHAGCRAEMKWVELECPLTIQDGLGPLVVLEMHNGALVERLAEIRRLRNEGIESRALLAAIAHLDQPAQLLAV